MAESSMSLAGASSEGSGTRRDRGPWRGRGAGRRGLRAALAAKSWLLGVAFLACLGAAAGCALREPADRGIVGTRAMRFDDRSLDVDLAGEICNDFGDLPGGGGGCST